MLKHNKILLFDFETTGLSAENSQIIEIGAILLEKTESGKYKLVDELSTLVLADGPLPSKIIEITHITDEMLLRDGITQEEAFHQLFKLYSEDALLVAYKWNGFGMPPVYWSALMILIAILLAVLMLKKFKAIPFALVVAWALWGIYNAQGPTAPILAKLTKVGINILCTSSLIIFLTETGKLKWFKK